MMISVITPVFNGERFIESCMRNVLEQQCHHLQHIIIDGASTDSTISFIKQFAAQYPHIDWISEKDRGQSDAMNKGIAMAKGEIIGILNVDDYYEPNTLRTIIKLFQKLPDPSFLVGNCNVWDDDNKLLYVSKPSKIGLANILLGRFMEAFPMNPSAYFYHASLHDIVGLYKTDEHYGMDLDFIIRAVQHANVEYRNELWGNYRFLHGTKSHTDEMNDGNASRVMSIVNAHLKMLPPHLKYLIYVRRLLRQGIGRVQSIFRKAFRRSMT